jgi:hypothetical protein
MALQTSATINGFTYDSLYISVVQTRKQKLYPKDEQGNDLAPEFKTWVYLQAFKDAKAKRDGFPMLQHNHVICLDGDIASVDIDQALKDSGIVIGQYGIDLGSSTLV